MGALKAMFSSTGELRTDGGDNDEAQERLRALYIQMLHQLDLMTRHPSELGDGA